MIGRIYKIVSDDLPDICYIGSTTRTLSDRWDMHHVLYKKWIDCTFGRYAIFPYFKKYGIDTFKIVLIKEYDIVDKKHLLAKEQLWINKMKNTAINLRAACQVLPLKVINRDKAKAYREVNAEKIQHKAKEYYQANKDKFREKTKAYYQKNKDKRKAYYQKNKDKHKAYQGVYRNTNKDKRKAYYKANHRANKDKNKAYYQANKDKIKEVRDANKDANKDKCRAYYQANKGKIKELRDANKDKIKAYYQANKDKLKEQRDANKDRINSYAKVKVECGCGSTYMRAGKSNHLKTKKHINWENQS